MLEDPFVELRLPVGVGGEDPPRDGEGLGIELEDGEVAEGVLCRIEELVVENAAGLAGLLQAEDPLLAGVLEGLRRLALDDVAEGFLTAVGLWQIDLVEGKERCRQQRGDDEDRQDDAVKTDAGGFHRGQLARLAHEAKDHEHGDEHARVA